MSAYEGLESFYCHFTLPHTTKIARKPKGIGCELKSIADSESGILLKLEIMEGKDRNRRKEFEDNYKSHTAITLRLSKGYFGSGRTIIGDSAFSSVDTCQALLDHGLHFIGLVKTASGRFPKAYFNTWASNQTIPRGSHKVLKTTVRTRAETEHQIFAVGWKDLKLKTLICSRGSTVPGTPCQKVRHILNIDGGRRETIRGTINVPRPKVVEMMFDSFSTIDVHDHYRQGSLAMEESWQTRTWWHRVFSSIFGIIITDAYFAYRLEFRRFYSRELEEFPDFQSFIGRLAHQMIFYNENKGKKSRRSSESREKEEKLEEVNWNLSG
jgi:hypothetical protein